MSNKALWALVVLLAALSGAMWMKGRPVSVPVGKDAIAGRGLIPSIDMGTVRSIAIEDGAATTHLAQVDGVWCVAEQGDYPADVNRLRTLMRSIDGAENPQVAETGAAHLAEYGLAVDGASAPLRISLEHDKGTTVLSLGKNRESRNDEATRMPAPGRYVRVGEGPVLLIKDDIAMVTADPDQWWDRMLLEVAPESIQKVAVGSGEGAYAIERGTNGMFSLVGGTAEEEVDLSAANRLLGALRSLRAEQILGEPTIFRNALSCRFEAEGATYSIHMGEALSDQGGGRPVKFEVVVAANATPDQRSAAALAEKKLKDRIFLISAYLADPLTLKKDALIHKPEVAPEPPPMPEQVVDAEPAN